MTIEEVIDCAQGLSLWSRMREFASRLFLACFFREFCFPLGKSHRSCREDALYGVDQICVVRFLYIATGAKDEVVRNPHSTIQNNTGWMSIFFKVLLRIGA